MLVTLLGEGQFVVGMFHHDFVCAQVAHLVVEPLPAPLGVTLDPIERPQVGDHAHLPLRMTVGVLVNIGRAKLLIAGAQRAGNIGGPSLFAVGLHRPALSDGIPSQFHAVLS